MPQSSDDQKKQPAGGYDVGYGKPPAKGRWKKGQSGNPSGKRKATKSWDQIASDVANEIVTVRIGDTTKRMTQFEAALRMNMIRAHRDPRSFAQITSLLRSIEPIIPVDQPMGGVLVVPAQVPLDEWQKVAEEQQRKYRSRSSEPHDES